MTGSRDTVLTRPSVDACRDQALPKIFPTPQRDKMPGVKANTQSKGKEKEKVGGGGAAGMKARTGGGETRDCFVCVPCGETRHRDCAPRARRARVGTQRRARTQVLSRPETTAASTHSLSSAARSPPARALRACSCKVKFNIRTPKAQLQEVGAGGAAGVLLLCGLAGRAACVRVVTACRCAAARPLIAPCSTWTASTRSSPSRRASRTTLREGETAGWGGGGGPSKMSTTMCAPRASLSEVLSS